MALNYAVPVNTTLSAKISDAMSRLRRHSYLAQDSSPAPGDTNNSASATTSRTTPIRSQTVSTKTNNAQATSTQATNAQAPSVQAQPIIAIAGGTNTVDRIAFCASSATPAAAAPVPAAPSADTAVVNLSHSQLEAAPAPTAPYSTKPSKSTPTAKHRCRVWGLALAGLVALSLGGVSAGIALYGKPDLSKMQALSWVLTDRENNLLYEHPVYPLLAQAELAHTQLTQAALPHPQLAQAELAHAQLAQGELANAELAQDKLANLELEPIQLEPAKLAQARIDSRPPAAMLPLHRILTTSKEVDPFYLKLLLLSEDPYFSYHPGVELFAYSKAILGSHPKQSTILAVEPTTNQATPDPAHTAPTAPTAPTTNSTPSIASAAPTASTAPTANSIPSTVSTAPNVYATTTSLAAPGATLAAQVARFLSNNASHLTYPINSIEHVHPSLTELAQALYLTTVYGRDKVLNLYLTLVPLGAQLDGLTAASYAYFQHSPQYLTPAEAALLVAIPHVIPAKEINQARYALSHSLTKPHNLSQSHTLSNSPLPPDRFNKSTLAALEFQLIHYRNHLLDQAQAAGLLSLSATKQAKAQPLSLNLRVCLGLVDPQLPQSALALGQSIWSQQLTTPDLTNLTNFPHLTSPASSASSAASPSASLAAFPSTSLAESTSTSLALKSSIDPQIQQTLQQVLAQVVATNQEQIALTPATIARSRHHDGSSSSNSTRASNTTHTSDIACASNTTSISNTANTSSNASTSSNENESYPIAHLSIVVVDNQNFEVIGYLDAATLSPNSVSKAFTPSSSLAPTLAPPSLGKVDRQEVGSAPEKSEAIEALVTQDELRTRQDAGAAPKAAGAAREEKAIVATPEEKAAGATLEKIATRDKIVPKEDRVDEVLEAKAPLLLLAPFIYGNAWNQGILTPESTLSTTYSAAYSSTAAFTSVTQGTSDTTVAKTDTETGTTTASAATESSASMASDSVANDSVSSNSVANNGVANDSVSSATALVQGLVAPVEQVWQLLGPEHALANLSNLLNRYDVTRNSALPHLNLPYPGYDLRQGGINLFDLTHLYAVLAQDGLSTPLRLTPSYRHRLPPEKALGKAIATQDELSRYANYEQSQRLFAPAVARTIFELLENTPLPPGSSNSKKVSWFGQVKPSPAKQGQVNTELALNPQDNFTEYWAVGTLNQLTMGIYLREGQPLSQATTAESAKTLALVPAQIYDTDELLDWHLSPAQQRLRALTKAQAAKQTAAAQQAAAPTAASTAAAAAPEEAHPAAMPAPQAVGTHAGTNAEANAGGKAWARAETRANAQATAAKAELSSPPSNRAAIMLLEVLQSLEDPQRQKEYLGEQYQAPPARNGMLVHTYPPVP